MAARIAAFAHDPHHPRFRSMVPDASVLTAGRLRAVACVARRSGLFALAAHAGEAQRQIGDGHGSGHDRRASGAVERHASVALRGRGPGTAHLVRQRAAVHDAGAARRRIAAVVPADAAHGADLRGGRCGVTAIKRNAVANLAGRIWSNILSVAFVPVYLLFLGIEAYGLVGFAATLQGVLLLLDVGIGASLLRELARLSATPGTERAQRDTVLTLETIYWTIALAGGALVFVLAPLIATHWVRPQHLATAVVITSIRIIGFMMAMQF